MPKTGQTDRTEPDQDADIARLIEVTYSSTADPDAYDDLITVWARYMARTPEIDRSGPHLTHFNNALGIFAALGRQRRSQNRADEMVNSFAIPALLCDRQMRVRSANPAARDLLQQEAGRNLLADPDLVEALTRLDPLTRTDMVPIGHRDGAWQDCAVISLVEDVEATPGSPGPSRTYLIVLTRPAGIGSPTWQRLVARFDLSSAESDVLFALISGESPDRIASQRGVSLNTVRSQIRTLLDKTGCPSITDMVRRILLICMQFETVALANRLSAPATAEDNHDLSSILTSDGRILSFALLGPEGGRPMLFIHNMMGGIRLPAHILRMAEARNWRIIAPSRAGFGMSDSVSLKGQALVERTVRDLRELLDHLAIEGALILGLMSSAGHALTFAQRYPQRTVAVLNIAHAGVMDDAMIDAMPSLTRTMAQTWRRSELALRFLTRVAVASVDVRGPEQMMRRMLTLNDADARLAADPDILGVMGKNLAHATVQGGEAFAKDGYVALNDFSATIHALDPAIPVLNLLGARDEIYRPAHALRLVPGLPNYPVEVLPDAGQYLFFDHSKTVLDRAETLWSRGAGRIAWREVPGRLPNPQK